MKNIAVVTTSRADFFLLKPLVVHMIHDDFSNPSLIVTGSHLSKQFGLTYKQIISEGIPIAHKVPMFKTLDNSQSISESIAKGLMGFAKLFSKHQFDLIVLLGDRSELFSIAIAAMNERSPIAHIHGGELTYGAIDEYVRHAITKMSAIHFAATEEYRKRIIQLGENPNRVFNVGSLGVENVLSQKTYSKNDLSKIFEFDFSKPYALVTFHPETLAAEEPLTKFKILMSALRKIESLNYIITYANHDSGGNLINDYLEKHTSKNMLVVKSLGSYYPSVMKFSEIVIGNSSSGIIEAPSLNVPTLNIGNRQEGRIRSESVVNCDLNKNFLIEKLNQILKNKKEMSKKTFKNPYYKKETSHLILNSIKNILDEGVTLKKTFHDMDALL